ncbi:PD-(D/E)XK nuclease superfamily protein [Chitinophaga sp. CF118]|uniref:DUF2357 domain-containing protein n=1 Tax=Chitinophaga sp. CF118 TaxID=1884367 RepID=UPI0008E50E89|nr:DUF2357 domain-containing protein [Chitinophaga sp. CF118]SFE77232.1 PD-(D/E)XK nuclease superfamily protein [Chitinophaga sp. CF118]
MNIIIIDHADFLLEISQEYMDAERIFSETFYKAKSRNTEKYFATAYSFSDMPLLRDFSIIDPKSCMAKNRQIESANYPVFFENTQYLISIEFIGDISEPKIYSKNKEVERVFKVQYTKHGCPIVFGNLEFRNCMGSFELNINYVRGTIPKTVVFRFDVFSAMVALKRDVPLMIKDIERIYPRLILDYIKITDHSFYNISGEYHEIVWWIVFDNIYNSLLKHFQYILDHPHISGTENKVWGKEEQVSSPKPALAAKMSRFRGNPHKFFMIPRGRKLEDNNDNRVVKFILRDVINKFRQIYPSVKKSESGKRMSNEYKGQLEFVEKALWVLQDDPFFQSVSDISEIRTMSHVLSLKSGYDGLLDDWKKLNEGYGLFEGLNALELKDSPYVYKLWCFLNMAEVIKSLDCELIEMVKVPEPTLAQFGFLPDKKMNARFKFKFGNGDILELSMELSYNDKYDENNIEAFRPDIILKVQKRDYPAKTYLTYLFDARYRTVESENEDQPDLPHPIDLVRMYYLRNKVNDSEYKKNRQRTEVMDTVVFYPGQGTLKQFKNLMAQNEQEGVRGIALNPGQVSTNSLIRDYISNIVNKDVATLFKEAYHNTRTDYRKEEVFIFIPYIAKGNTSLINYLKETKAPLFCFEKFLPSLGNGLLGYCAPYIEGEGIPVIYEITGHDWKPRKEVYPPDHELFQENNTECLVLKLKHKEALKEPFQIKGVVKAMRYTRMKYLNKPVDGFIKTIPERETLTRNS